MNMLLRVASAYKTMSTLARQVFSGRYYTGGRNGGRKGMERERLLAQISPQFFLLSNIVVDGY